MKKNIIEKVFPSQHKCLILLIIFLIWLLAGTSFIDTPYGNIYIAVCIIFLAMGPFVINRNNKLLMSSLVLAAVAFTLKIMFHSSNIPWMMPYLCLVLLFFDFAMTMSVIYYTTMAGRYTRDSIFGSIFTYLMIGVCFADTYYMLQYFEWIQFTARGVPKIPINLEDCFYFSFTSLTTMGYGDIIPYTPLAKRLSYLEAAAGTMYTAVFIGRLISTYGSHQAGEK